MPPGLFPKKLAATAVSTRVSTAIVPWCAASAIVVTATIVNGSYVVVASTVVTVHPVVLHIALTGSIVHLITSVIIHNVLLSGKLHRKVRLHGYSMNNCGIGAYNWGARWGGVLRWRVEYINGDDINS